MAIEHEDIFSEIRLVEAEVRATKRVLWAAIPLLVALSAGVYAYARADLTRHEETMHGNVVTADQLDAASASRDSRMDDLARRLDRIEQKVDQLLMRRR